MKLFISHAAEDKDQVARPLAIHLRQLGYQVWYDEFSLSLGDHLRQEIERGLRECDFGVVILSPNFFGKEWPQRELDGLLAREVNERRKVILPVWHKVDSAAVSRASPILAGKFAVSTDKGVEAVAKLILETINVSSHPTAAYTIEDQERAERLYLQGLAEAFAKEGTLEEANSESRGDRRSLSASEVAKSYTLQLVECPHCGEGDGLPMATPDYLEKRGIGWYKCNYCHIRFSYSLGERKYY